MWRVPFMSLKPYKPNQVYMETLSLHNGYERALKFLNEWMGVCLLACVWHKDMHCWSLVLCWMTEMKVSSVWRAHGFLRGLIVCLSRNKQMNVIHQETQRVFLPLQPACISAFSFIFIIYSFPLPVVHPPPTIYHCPERAPSLLCSSSEPASDYRSGLILPGRVTSWADLEIIAGNGTDLCMYSNKYHYGFELLNIFANKF